MKSALRSFAKKDSFRKCSVDDDTIRMVTLEYQEKRGWMATGTDPATPGVLPVFAMWFTLVLPRCRRGETKIILTDGSKYAWQCGPFVYTRLCGSKSKLVLGPQAKAVVEASIKQYLTK